MTTPDIPSIASVERRLRVALGTANACECSDCTMKRDALAVLAVARSLLHEARLDCDRQRKEDFRGRGLFVDEDRAILDALLAEEEGE